MWVKLNRQHLNMNQVVYVDEEARSITLSTGRTVRITDASLTTVMRHVKGLPICTTKPKAKRGENE